VRGPARSRPAIWRGPWLVCLTSERWGTGAARIRDQYWDFRPTLAAEKLREVHEITLGRETLRQWMIEAGIWADRKQRRKRVYQPRYRRDCVGELVQVDGCEHAARIHRRCDRSADAMVYAPMEL
jgi:hypothetical protein